MLIEIAVFVAGATLYLQAPGIIRAAGQRSQQRGNHRQAYHHFLRAGSLLPPIKLFAEFRSAVTTQAALAAYNAGMGDEATRLAKKAIETSPDTKRRMVAHSALALGYGATGNLKEQRTHWEQALTLAEALGDKTSIAQYGVGIAGSQYKQGELIEAIAASERAEDADPSSASLALSVKAECLRKMGRYSEAIVVLQKAQVTVPLPIEFWENRKQSTLLLAMAANYIEEGNAQAGMKAVTAARTGFGDDARLQLLCDAAEANSLGLSGETDKASVLIHKVLGGLEVLTDDLAMHETCLDFVGKAALNAGNPAQALQLFGRLLNIAASPVDLPDVYFWIGECHIRLGNEDEARKALVKATQFDFESVYTRRAAMRLTELDSEQK